MTAQTSVLVDARELTGESSYSGVGTYIRGLLSGLAQRDDLAVAALATPDATVPGGVEHRHIRRHFESRRRSVIEHATRVALDVARTRADVYHNASVHAPGGIRKPFVQTLFDVIPLIDDDPALAALRSRWKRFGPRYRRANAVLAISRHAADDGIRHLGLDPRRVEVTHLGVSPRFTPSGPRLDDGLPFLLLVSEYSRRKGFEEALQVIDRVAAAGFPHTLKLVGRVRDHSRPEFDQLLASAPRPDRVEVLGFVDDVTRYYRSASVVLVLSRFEGFGLPAVEAMASGAPLVSFDNSSLPEIVDDGGLLVPDGDVVAAAAAVIDILRSPGLAEDLAGRGLQRATKFTWAECAATTAAVYREVARTS